MATIRLTALVADGYMITDVFDLGPKEQSSLIPHSDPPPQNQQTQTCSKVRNAAEDLRMEVLAARPGTAQLQRDDF